MYGSRLILVLLPLALAAAPAASQSCWPVGVLLAARDGEGRRIDPAALDSVVTSPGSPEPRRVVRPYQDATTVDSATLLQWSRAGCVLSLGTVTIWLGGRPMRLHFDMQIDSEVRRKGSVFLFEAPPFQEGDFRLRWDPDEPGGYEDPPLLRGRWTRMHG